MSLTVLIPAKNECKIILSTLNKIKKKLLNKIKYEIIVIDDFSSDNTFEIVKKIKNKNIKIFKNKKIGLGGAISEGILRSRNDYVCIFMADCSDSICDMINYYLLAKKNSLDAVFGSRFLKKSKIDGYPFFKLFLNRVFNYFVMIIFFCKFNDYTNAFKLYKKNFLRSLLPIFSESFNVFLELPLRAITQKKKYIILPISWKERKNGSSKFRIRELGSKYFSTLIFCFFERIAAYKNSR